ncbi:hypothetical protein L210DRAFT_867443 [Boletus edulis BED1]|uniref:Uncharacterized protein n=1 Tax=Boletus edulis BED1 TaxID=1328754 RepID=A0AAD4BU50_BOLED|nr:hypothetical protein L210DRAFT_867443 [Boletus edulis BED1]
MDIKFVGSGPAAKALVYYITDYITKSDVKLHTGVHTLQAALKSHAQKFHDDSTASQPFRDRNLVTKCINSLMGRQEISHQQVMSYLVGGGDHYTSHAYRPFRFYDFLHALSIHERATMDVIALDASEHSPVDNDLDTEEVSLDVSSGDVTITSDLMDYQWRPKGPLFDQMSVWEFVECSRKVSSHINVSFILT